jgi:hypothetical protein
MLIINLKFQIIMITCSKWNNWKLQKENAHSKYILLLTVRQCFEDHQVQILLVFNTLLYVSIDVCLTLIDPHRVQLQLQFHHPLNIAGKDHQMADIVSRTFTNGQYFKGGKISHLILTLNFLSHRRNLGKSSTF